MGETLTRANRSYISYQARLRMCTHGYGLTKQEVVIGNQAAEVGQAILFEHQAQVDQKDKGEAIVDQSLDVLLLVGLDLLRSHRSSSHGDNPAEGGAGGHTVSKKGRSGLDQTRLDLAQIED